MCFVWKIENFDELTNVYKKVLGILFVLISKSKQNKKTQTFIDIVK